MTPLICGIIHEYLIFYKVFREYIYIYIYIYIYNRFVYKLAIIITPHGNNVFITHFFTFVTAHFPKNAQSLLIDIRNYALQPYPVYNINQSKNFLLFGYHVLRYITHLYTYVNGQEQKSGLWNCNKILPYEANQLCLTFSTKKTLL